jgi:hypothetical protein
MKFSDWCESKLIKNDKRWIMRFPYTTS